MYIKNKRGYFIFKKDIERGVKHFKDCNYNQYGSAGSLRFFNYAKKFMTDVKRVELKYDQKHWYRMKIVTVTGQEFLLYGCSFGYGGEGSRASKEILLQLGFDEKKASRVFEIRDHFKNKQDKMILIKR